MAMKQDEASFRFFVRFTIMSRILSSAEVHWSPQGMFYQVSEGQDDQGENEFENIISAAHCIERKNSQKNTRLSPEDLAIFLGRHNLNLKAERNSRTEDVSAIAVHPEWKRRTLSYDADVSVITIKKWNWVLSSHSTDLFST